MAKNEKPKRIHIDFHTSDLISIGDSFDENAFERVLLESGVDAINLFAKCHHGNFYYENTKFHKHPLLKKDLLPLQLATCKRTNVDAYVYVSAGCDQAMAVEHPEWCIKYKKGEDVQYGPYYTLLCFNTPYLDLLCDHVREVVETFHPEGIFLDIIAEHECWCDYCLRDMAVLGLNPDDTNDRKIFKRKVLHKYYDAINKAAEEMQPGIKIFHNSGNVPRGRKDMLAINTHYELESLPTSIWGYDHFPATLSYMRHKGKDCIGMTGKFHEGWGDFGTYKYPDALLYEAAQSLAMGAGICVGDQLHPSGKIDEYTYQNISNAFRYYAQFEKYNHGKYYAEVGVLSEDLIENRFLQEGDTGICRMLLEEKILFDMLDLEDVSNQYKVIVLPDTLTLTEEICTVLKGYLAGGGKLLASGKSTLYNGNFAFDLGAKYIGEDELQPCYFQPNYPVKYFREEPLVIKAKTEQVEGTGKVLAKKLYPYFNRSAESFCSHLHTPCDYEKEGAGITQGKDGAYISAHIFADYKRTGNMADKLLVMPILDDLLGERIVRTNLPSQAKVSMVQTDDGDVLHLLFANTIKRGQGIEIIEDIVPLVDVSVDVKVQGRVKGVSLLPNKTPIAFTQTGDRIAFTVDKFRVHTAILIERE